MKSLSVAVPGGKTYHFVILPCFKRKNGAFGWAPQIFQNEHPSVFSMASFTAASLTLARTPTASGFHFSFGTTPTSNVASHTRAHASECFCTPHLYRPNTIFNVASRGCANASKHDYIPHPTPAHPTTHYPNPGKIVQNVPVTHKDPGPNTQPGDLSVASAEVSSKLLALYRI